MPAGEGILLFDETGSVVGWNPVLEQITGPLRTDVLGKKLWDIHFSLLSSDKKTSMHPGHLKDLVLSAMKEGMLPELVRRAEYGIQHPETGIRIVESITFMVPDGDRITAGSIIRDITERKKAVTSLPDTNRKLISISSTARHDINNQLTVFNGYLSLLEGGTSETKSRDMIRILQGATDKIVRILAFTREYQDIGVKPPAWQNLCETIRLAKTMIDAGATVLLFPDKTCENVEIRADPRFVRVFHNLIENSLRHGETVSEIRIHCAVEDNHLLMVYEDNGIGISDWIRPVLFERGKVKHTGIGMFLVREIPAVTGIPVAENGTAGKGARFEMIVPAVSFRITGRR